MILSDGQKQSALKQLEDVSAAEEDFKVAVEEVMKISYESQDWNRFFSYAQFYRKAYPLSELKTVFLLEPLALMRHCQVDVLNRYFESYEEQTGKLLPEMHQMKALSQTQFRGKSSKTQKGLETKSRLRGSSLWKTDHKVVGLVHPKKIKIKVENLCEA